SFLQDLDYTGNGGCLLTYGNINTINILISLLDFCIYSNGGLSCFTATFNQFPLPFSYWDKEVNSCDSCLQWLIYFPTHNDTRGGTLYPSIGVRCTSPLIINVITQRIYIPS